MWEERRRGREIREKIETWREQRTLARTMQRLQELARIGKKQRGKKD